MTLLIHGCNGGAISESNGLEEHISDVRHLENIGYKVVRLPLPSGDWGDKHGRLYPVRRAGDKYSRGECDAAEFCD